MCGYPAMSAIRPSSCGIDVSSAARNRTALSERFNGLSVDVDIKREVSYLCALRRDKKALETLNPGLGAVVNHVQKIMC